MKLFTEMIPSTILNDDDFSDFDEHSSENKEELDEIEDEEVDDEEELYHSAYVACQTMMKWLRVYGCHEHKPSGKKCQQIIKTITGWFTKFINLNVIK